MSATVSHFYSYPLKSCYPMYNNRVDVDLDGFLGDRVLALVDRSGQLLTGREYPTLARLMCSLESDSFSVRIQDDQHLFHLKPNGERLVQLFDVNFKTEFVSKEADEWFSDLLREPVRLVRNHSRDIRYIKAKYNQENASIRMSDAAPILLINQESLKDLNTRLEQPVEDIVFRPNIVVKEMEAYAELGLKRISIGGLPFKVMSSCKRCKFITLNYDSYDFHPKQEPLRTLASYMKNEKGTAEFGIYLVPEKRGELHAGAKLTILD